MMNERLRAGFLFICCVVLRPRRPYHPCSRLFLVQAQPVEAVWGRRIFSALRIPTSFARNRRPQIDPPSKQSNYHCIFLWTKHNLIPWSTITKLTKQHVPNQYRALIAALLRILLT